jgi:hypothetical protein
MFGQLMSGSSSTPMQRDHKSRFLQGGRPPALLKDFWVGAKRNARIN